MFLMWLGEQITERGLGNGISLLIFAGIAAGLPAAIGQTLEQARTGAYSSCWSSASPRWSSSSRRSSCSSSGRSARSW